MNNQAQRKQDLELWEVVKPADAGTVQRRTAKQGSHKRTAERNRAGANVPIITLPSPRQAPKRRRHSQNAAGYNRTHRNTVRTNARMLRRRKVRQRRLRLYRFAVVTSLLAMCVVLFFVVRLLYQEMQIGMHADDRTAGQGEQPVFWENLTPDKTERKPEIKKDFLSISEYNRPGTRLAAVNNIFVHYTANPKTTAAQNRSYFEGLAQTHERAASAHFIIGWEGEIIQCIPLDEEAYAVMGRNNDSISIECCYISEDGSFTQETYNSLIHMLAWLIHEYDLEAQDILRHYDSNEKLCPLYYVEHQDAWDKLLYDVRHYKFE